VIWTAAQKCREGRRKVCDIASNQIPRLSPVNGAAQDRQQSMQTFGAQRLGLEAQPAIDILGRSSPKRRAPRAGSTRFLARLVRLAIVLGSRPIKQCSPRQGGSGSDRTTGLLEGADVTLDRADADFERLSQWLGRPTYY
jgi:hypothetical protein